MTPNFEELIKSIKKLNSKEVDLEEKIQYFHHYAKEIRKKTKLNQEYNEELQKLNAISHHQNRSSLIENFENDLKTIKDLETENKELESAINQHKQVLKIVLTKYNEHTKALKKLNNLEKSYKIDDKKDLVNERHKYVQQKSSELLTLFNSGLILDETVISDQQKLINKIKNENLKIKKLLLSPPSSMVDELSSENNNTEINHSSS